MRYPTKSANTSVRTTSLLRGFCEENLKTQWSSYLVYAGLVDFWVGFIKYNLKPSSMPIGKLPSLVCMRFRSADFVPYQIVRHSTQHTALPVCASLRTYVSQSPHQLSPLQSTLASSPVFCASCWRTLSLPRKPSAIRRTPSCI